MIEELFYLDEGHIKITAASVGISRKRWTSIKEVEIKDDNYQSIMSKARYDILPIISENGNTYEFFKTNTPNCYDKISRLKISYTDVLPLDTSIREVIKGFATEEKTYYFLSFQLLKEIFFY